MLNIKVKKCKPLEEDLISAGFAFAFRALTQVGLFVDIPVISFGISSVVSQRGSRSTERSPGCRETS